MTSGQEVSRIWVALIQRKNILHNWYPLWNWLGSSKEQAPWNATATEIFLFQPSSLWHTKYVIFHLQCYEENAAIFFFRINLFLYFFKQDWTTLLFNPIIGPLGVRGSTYGSRNAKRDLLINKWKNPYKCIHPYSYVQTIFRINYFYILISSIFSTYH